MSPLSEKILNFFTQRPLLNLFVVAAPVVLVYFGLKSAYDFVLGKAEELIIANPTISLLTSGALIALSMYWSSKNPWVFFDGPIPYGEDPGNPSFEHN